MWIAEGAEVSPDAVLRGPLYIGDYAKVEAGVEIREHTVIGSNVVVKSGAFLHRAVIHDNVYIGPHSNLRGCVIGKNTDIMRAARIEDGAVIGDECLVGEESIVQGNVRVYPFKTIEAGAFVNTSVIWESRGQAHLFGARGVSGILNVEITPELVVRLAGAYATTLKKGAIVTTARDHSRGARALKRAVISALQASAINVRDLENVPLPVARQQTARGSAGGIVLRTSPGVPDSVDIMFLDERGADLSLQQQRKLDRVYARQEYRRAFPGEIGDLQFPGSVFDAYTGSLLRRVDITGVADSGLKVVVDASNGSAGLVLPSLLGRLGVDALTVNPGLDESRPTETRSPGGPGWCGWARSSRPRGRPSVCASTPWASGSPWSTSAGGSSRTTGPCWSSSTWSRRRSAAARWRCPSPPPGSPSRWRRTTGRRWSGRRPRRTT